MTNLLLIYGGKSVEHDISILTMKIINEYLDKEKYKIYYLYIEKNGNFIFSNQKKKRIKKVFFNKNKINNIKIDIALLLLHGTNGEDGKIQGLLDLYNIKYVGSKVVNSAIMQDKCYMKMILKSNDIDTLDYDIITDKKNYNKNYLYPIILKPANLGSSIGIEIVKNESELEEKINKCFKFDNKILVERYLENITEYNIAVMGNNIQGFVLSNIEKVYKSNELLDFNDKYINPVKKELNANLPLELKEKINNLALKCAKVFDITGVVRIDFIVENNEVYLNEINSIPGSLAFYLFNIEPDKFLDLIIKNSFNYYDKLEKKCYTFESSVLNAKKSIKK